MDEDRKRDGGGLAVPADPGAEERAQGGPGEQAPQDWPGREEPMRPQPDHGEQSYRGSGKLEGRHALVTGGDSGIGKAVAIAFAREGADVAIAYYEEHEDAHDTIRWIEEAGRSALAVDGDLMVRDHCRHVVDRTVAELGGLDIVVNNAAYHCQTESLADIGEEQLERTFRTNVYSYFWITQAALPHLEEGSVILNTGSVVALRGSPELLDYAATKGAVHVFTRSLATALSDRGVRVNCVAPGPVWTPLIASTKKQEDIEEFGADSEWGRPAQPAELAPAFEFLASPDSRYCTGEILSITGMATTR